MVKVIVFLQCLLYSCSSADFFQEGISKKGEQSADDGTPAQSEEASSETEGPTATNPASPTDVDSIDKPVDVDAGNADVVVAPRDGAPGNTAVVEISEPLMEPSLSQLSECGAKFGEGIEPVGFVGNSVDVDFNGSKGLVLVVHANEADLNIKLASKSPDVVGRVCIIVTGNFVNIDIDSKIHLSDAIITGGGNDFEVNLQTNQDYVTDKIDMYDLFSTDLRINLTGPGKYVCPTRSEFRTKLFLNLTCDNEI